jgi:hypothetical protein
MFKNLYEWMAPRVGSKAARAGLRVQYTNILLIVVGWGGVILAYVGPVPAATEINLLLVLLLLACLVGVYARIQFARTLSEYFSTKVRWYRLPFVAQKRLFNKWLEEIGEDPSSKA